MLCLKRCALIGIFATLASISPDMGMVAHQLPKWMEAAGNGVALVKKTEGSSRESKANSVHPFLRSSLCGHRRNRLFSLPFHKWRFGNYSPFPKNHPLLQYHPFLRRRRVAHSLFPLEKVIRRAFFSAFFAYIDHVRRSLPHEENQSMLPLWQSCRFALEIGGK